MLQFSLEDHLSHDSEKLEHAFGTLNKLKIIQASHRPPCQELEGLLYKFRNNKSAGELLADY